MSKNKVIPGAGFCHIALGAVDFDASLAFYKALGMEVFKSWGEAPHRAVMLDIGDGGVIEMFEGTPDTPQVNPHWQHLAIATTDTDAAFAAALKAGAKPKTEPADVVIGCAQGDFPVRIAFVYGPSGEEIEFFCIK